MASSKTFSLLFFLIFLLASQEKTMHAEARVCQSQSHKFHGQCWSSHNCAMVCKNEGFTGGKCQGFRHRCFCTKNC